MLKLTLQVVYASPNTYRLDRNTFRFSERFVLMLLMFMQNTQLNKEICTAKQDMHTAPSGICTFWFLLEVNRIGGVTAKNNFGISTSLIFDQQPSKCGEARNISVVGTKSDNFERRTHRRTFVRVTCPKTVPTPVTRSGFFLPHDAMHKRSL